MEKLNMIEFVPKRKKLLTRPVLKYVVDVPNYVLIEAVMHVGKEMKQKEGDKKKDPATLCNVIDLKTGEPCQLIMNAVVKSVMAEEYPNDTYVGKCFSITKQARVAGKSYDPFSIEEIENPNDGAGQSASSTSMVDSGKSESSHTQAAGKRR
jgi:hypothetical protein